MLSYTDYKNLTKKILQESENDSNVPDEIMWKKWRELVNMTSKEISDFYDSDDGKDTGISSSKLDIGRESARILMKMVPDGSSFELSSERWNPSMWRWCRKQVAFISRTLKMRKRMVGNPFEREGKKTRWLKSLMLWGHDPRKPVNK